MWTLVFKKDDQEYDAVPNNWVTDNNRCLYPDKSKSSLIKLAKQCAPAESDWLSCDIELVKRDYENFERCMTDAIRRQSNKRTVTESEAELGKKRNTKKRDRSISPSSSAILSSPCLTPPRPKLKPKFHINRPRIPFVKSVSNNSVNQPPYQPQIGSCKIGKPHICPFSFNEGQIDLIAVADSQCSNSRGLTIMNKALKEMNNELRSRLSKMESQLSQLLEGGGGSTQPAAVDIPLHDESDDVLEIVQRFPFQNKEELIKFDQELEDSEFRKRAIVAMLSKGIHTSLGRSVSTVLKGILSENVVNQYTWRGQRRFGVKKDAFGNMKITKCLLGALSARWKTDTGNVERSFSSWLAHAQLKSTRIVGPEADVYGELI